MPLNYLAFSVPFFVLLMLIEFYVARRKKHDYFDLRKSVANISVGIAERLSDVLISGMFYFIYDYIQKRFGLFIIKPGIWVWILLLLGTDLIWYWYHRLAHEINIFWAAHVVHHQSEDFNYTVSARITVFQAILRTGFWCVLPLLGFPAGMITVMLLIHGLYPFFIHTRVIGKLGWLEYILVTPSHHRVHHACNEQYLDKNYGDVFIIWDKLFGTFAVENDEPVYGLTKQLRTSSFLWQHFHFFIELYLAVASQKTVIRKLKIIFGSPHLIDPEERIKAERIFNIRQKKMPLAEGLNTYVIWQIAVLLIVLFFFILFEKSFSPTFKFLFTGFTVLTLVNCGAIMEQKKWIFNVEFMRFLVLAAIIIPFYTENELLIASLVVLIVLLVMFYRSLEHVYLATVYKPA